MSGDYFVDDKETEPKACAVLIRASAMNKRIEHGSQKFFRDWRTFVAHFEQHQIFVAFGVHRDVFPTAMLDRI